MTWQEAVEWLAIYPAERKIGRLNGHYGPWRFLYAIRETPGGPATWRTLREASGAPRSAGRARSALDRRGRLDADGHLLGDAGAP